jgi:hypothetical protein
MPALRPRVMQSRSPPVRRPGAAAMLAAAVVAGSLSGPTHAQFTPAQAAQIRNALNDRIEALTIFGGDWGIAAANFRASGKFSFGENTDNTLAVTKLGGSGDIGDPQPLGSLPIGWQPRLQGNMGWLMGTNHLDTGELAGDTSQIKAYGIEFGGGARFWATDRLSFAPTLTGLYGHMSNTYTANSAFMREHLPEATELGLVDWTVDTWTLITGIDVQYVYTWNRTIITFSSNPVYYHTESFKTSNANLNVAGDSESWANIIDVDIPLGMELFGHELRTGGYYRWTGLYGDLKSGLNDLTNLNEIHGRLVLDFLNQLWKVQWIGVGGSYLWGPHITGWTIGADVVFRF